jgi:diguanylate cyclase (GGDEF)-like protein
MAGSIPLAECNCRHGAVGGAKRMHADSTSSTRASGHHDLWSSRARKLEVRLRATWLWCGIGLGLAPAVPLGLWIWFHLAGFDGSVPVTRHAFVFLGIITALVLGGFGFGTGLLMDRLRVAALHDGLTGVFNRRFLRESMPQLQASAARRRVPMCVIMIDLDHFKRVNDQYGHIIGDQTLCAVSDVLRANCRRSDLLARYGGEEFAILCPDTDCDTALLVAERLRVAVESLDEDALGHPGPQTISLGVAVQSGRLELLPERLIDHADTALYEAKLRGRNRTTVWLDGEEYLRWHTPFAGIPLA